MLEIQITACNFHLEIMKVAQNMPVSTSRTLVTSKNIKSDEEILSWAKGFGIPIVEFVALNQSSVGNQSSSIVWRAIRR